MNGRKAVVRISLSEFSPRRPSSPSSPRARATSPPPGAHWHPQRQAESPRAGARMAGPQGGAPPCGGVDWAPDLHCAASGVTAVGRQGGGDERRPRPSPVIPAQAGIQYPQRSCIAREVPPAPGAYWIPVFGDAETGMTPPGRWPVPWSLETAGRFSCPPRWPPSPASPRARAEGPRPGAHWSPQRQAESPRAGARRQGLKMAPPCGGVDWAPDLRCAASGVTVVARQGIAPGRRGGGNERLRALPCHPCAGRDPVSPKGPFSRGKCLPHPALTGSRSSAMPKPG